AASHAVEALELADALALQLPGAAVRGDAARREQTGGDRAHQAEIAQGDEHRPAQPPRREIGADERVLLLRVQDVGPERARGAGAAGRAVASPARARCSPPGPPRAGAPPTGGTSADARRRRAPRRARPSPAPHARGREPPTATPARCRASARPARARAGSRAG